MKKRGVSRLTALAEQVDALSVEDMILVVHTMTPRKKFLLLCALAEDTGGFYDGWFVRMEMQHTGEAHGTPPREKGAGSRPKHAPAKTEPT